MKTQAPNIPALALQLEILAQQIRHEKDPASQLLMIATARWLVERMSEQPRPATFEQPTFARSVTQRMANFLNV